MAGCYLPPTGKARTKNQPPHELSGQQLGRAKGRRGSGWPANGERLGRRAPRRRRATARKAAVANERNRALKLSIGIAMWPIAASYVGRVVTHALTFEGVIRLASPPDAIFRLSQLWVSQIWVSHE